MATEDEKQKRGKLFAAAWRGEFDAVKDIIEARSIDINAQDDNGVTALRFTAQFGHYELTKYLLDKGANPNIKAKDELDPLMAAVESGDKSMVTLLIDRGADLNSRTKLTTPVYIANEKGHVEISELLVERGAPLHPDFLWQLRRSILKRVENLSCING